MVGMQSHLPEWPIETGGKLCTVTHNSNLNTSCIPESEYWLCSMYLQRERKEGRREGRRKRERDGGREREGRREKGEREGERERERERERLHNDQDSPYFLGQPQQHFAWWQPPCCPSCLKEPTHGNLRRQHSNRTRPTLCCEAEPAQTCFSIGQRHLCQPLNALCIVNGTILVQYTCVVYDDRVIITMSCTNTSDIPLDIKHDPPLLSYLIWLHHCE